MCVCACAGDRTGIRSERSGSTSLPAWCCPIRRGARRAASCSSCTTRAGTTSTTAFSAARDVRRTGSPGRTTPRSPASTARWGDTPHSPGSRPMARTAGSPSVPACAPSTRARWTTALKMASRATAAACVAARAPTASQSKAAPSAPLAARCAPWYAHPTSLLGVSTRSSSPARRRSTIRSSGLHVAAAADPAAFVSRALARRANTMTTARPRRSALRAQPAASAQMPGSSRAQASARTPVPTQPLVQMAQMTARRARRGSTTTTLPHRPKMAGGRARRVSPARPADIPTLSRRLRAMASVRSGPTLHPARPPQLTARPALAASTTTTRTRRLSA